jgi:hypothetical protein
MLSAKTQTWLILFLGASHKSGLLPLPKTLLHRIIFLSNCLAPLFEEIPDSARIVKYKRGPFYPVVQWHLDHLAVTGAIDVSDVTYIDDEFGIWMQARYSINQRTKQIIEKCREINYGKRLDDYLTEVAFSFASLNKRFWDEAVLLDKTYNAPGVSEGAFIDFSEEHQNFSLQAAEAFKTILPKEVVPSRKEELFLYVRFLEELTRKKRAA